MKKTITILAAVMMVLSFAGMASAEDCPANAINCPGEAGFINVCDEQSSCTFDFENAYDYCEFNKVPNRAIIPICECDECSPGFIANLAIDATYQIGMTIMVDKGNGPVEGTNGVYWAQDVASIPMDTYANSGDACADNSYDKTFGGPFAYYEYLSATPGTVNQNAACVAVPVGQRVVEIRPTAAATGYQILDTDIIGQNSNWAIDIPAMRADLTVVEAGWDVYVEICIKESISESGTICSDCGQCCFMLKIGTLCCPDEEVGYSRTLIFPYLGKSDGAWWNGIAVTNLTSQAGTANVTLYENGDVFTGTVAVAANISEIIDVTALTLTTANGDGEMGNERSYVKVVTDFNASGFAMMAKESNGVSMGYLPINGN